MPADSKLSSKPKSPSREYIFTGQEQYTNLQIADNSVENTDIVPSWACVILPDL